MAIQVWLSKKTSTLKNKWFWLWNHSKKVRLSSESILNKLKIVAKSTHIKAEINLNSSKISDLLLIDDTYFEITKWQFLEDALKRLENQENCLTYVRNGRLRSCIWYKGTLDSVGKLEEFHIQNKLTKIYASRLFVL